jgi:hypothetical protein
MDIFGGIEQGITGTNATEMQPMTCATCSNARVGEKMKGWVNCSYGKSYEYLAPRRECQFKPAKWVKRTA